jgi:hypothetical protein
MMNVGGERVIGGGGVGGIGVGGEGGVKVMKVKMMTGSNKRQVSDINDG